MSEGFELNGAITLVKVRNGQDGASGSAPSIGENGNWFIDNIDTGIKAKGDSSYINVRYCIDPSDGEMTEEVTAQTQYVGVYVSYELDDPNINNKDSYQWSKLGGESVYSAKLAYSLVDFNGNPVQSEQDGIISIGNGGRIKLECLLYYGSKIVEDNIKYRWFSNDIENTSITTNIFEIPVEETFTNLTIICQCYLNSDTNNLLATDTISFSEIIDVEIYDLELGGNPRRYLEYTKNGENYDTTYKVSPSQLPIYLYKNQGTQRTSITGNSIYIQTNDDDKENLIEAPWKNEGYYAFQLEDWYNTYKQIKKEEKDIVPVVFNVYLTADIDNKTPIGQFYFDDALENEYMQVQLNNYKWQALIDKKSMVFDTNGLTLYNGAFKICSKNESGDVDNLLYFDTDEKTLYLKGGIIASKGYIGDKVNETGWEIGPKSLYNGTDSMTSKILGTYIGTDGIRNYKNDNAYVNIQDGVIKAIGAEITGTINATEGYIGSETDGWTITSNSLYNKTESMTSVASGTYIGTDGIRNYSSNNAYVNIKQGIITAVGAEITGKINATSGYIGGENGWIIDTKKLYTNGGPSEISSKKNGLFMGWFKMGGSVDAWGIRFNSISTKGTIIYQNGLFLTTHDANEEDKILGVSFASIGGSIHSNIQASLFYVSSITGEDGPFDVSGFNTIDDLYLFDGGSVGTFHAPNPNPGSDRRLKNNILYFSSDLNLSNSLSSFFDDLKPVRFCYNYDSSEHFGFIAQDVAESLSKYEIPSEKLQLIKKDSKDYYTLNYVEFVPLLIKEVQELKKRVSELENLQSN